MGIFWFLVLISFGAFTTGITLMNLSEAIGSGMHGQLETLIVANFIVTYFLIWLGNLIFQLSLKKRFEKLEAKISDLHRDLRKGLEMNGDIMKRDENSIVPSSGALDVDVENITNQAELEELVKTTTNWSVRVAATKKITNQHLLAKLAKGDPFEYICRIAVENITDRALLEDIAETANNRTICKMASLMLQEFQGS